MFTLLVSMAVLFVGQLLATKVSLLKRFSIPAPVIGGGLMAIAIALVDGFLDIKVSFNMSIKDSLLLIFFTTVGLAADARMLLKGGMRLVIFLLIGVGLIVIQNAIGILISFAIDMHPVVGLLSGSITLVGGHGTGAAYAGKFGETMNIQGAMELAMACATAGLVIGGVLGGPFAEYLIKRHKLSGYTPGEVQVTEDDETGTLVDTIASKPFLVALFIILFCLAGGRILAKLMEGTGFILPDFVFCLLLGVVIRNVATLTKVFRLSDASVDLIGGVALSLFLVMALMTMKLLDLANLAGPLLLILFAQTVAMILFAALITFRIMGSNYDAAIMSAGQIGFGMSSTACALAIMKAVTERHGPSALAFLIVPMVGAFFIDITNALIIQLYLALPFFGF